MIYQYPEQWPKEGIMIASQAGIGQPKLKPNASPHQTVDPSPFKASLEFKILGFRI